MAHAIRHRDVAAVGDGVGALDRLPRAVLALAILRFFAGMPADGRGEKENLRASQRGQPRGLGIPLVPADADADLRKLRLPRAEAEVARREVEFLVKQRVVRDVHLPVFAEVRAVGVDDRSGVVVEARAAFFEKRGDDDDAALLRQPGHRRGARAGDLLGELEVFVILDLAEILRGEKLLQADDLRAAVRRLGGLGERLREVFARLRGAAHLDETEGDFAGCGRHAKKKCHAAHRRGVGCGENVRAGNGNQPAKSPRTPPETFARGRVAVLFRHRLAHVPQAGQGLLTASPPAIQTPARRRSCVGRSCGASCILPQPRK